MIISQLVKKIKPSATMSITSKVKQMISSGIDVIGFGAGEPDFDTPDYIKTAAIESLQNGFTKYTPTSGILELKEAICKKLLQENGVNYTPKQVIISCGAKHSIYNTILALCNPGDEVLVPSPYWVSYPEQITLANSTPVFIHTDDSKDFKISVEDLKRSITDKTKLLILNSPSNPTGSVYTKEELYEIADFAIQAGLYIISDEIYEKIVYDGTVHYSPASFGEKFAKNVITVNGLSKTFSMTGWRIGYMAGPEELVKATELIQDHSTSCPNSFSQKAAVVAIRGKDDITSKMVSEFDRRRRYIVERLNKIEGITCRLPKGAFYVFPNISGLYGRKIAGETAKNSSEFVSIVLDKAKVAVVPGICFGSDSHVRLSYATSFENIEKGMDRLENLLTNSIPYKN
ncbi:MAG: pyridoxal phosphate-dependent aminotransferase [Candidatus Scalindua sp.]|nr:pyridoxal phosphate-dependent aminotransferase [Candidatus Scalindua sp.]